VTGQVAAANAYDGYGQITQGRLTGPKTQVIRNQNVNKYLTQKN
jgi:hypothetical protein